MSDTSYVKKVTFNTENLPPIPPLVRQGAVFFEPPPIPPLVRQDAVFFEPPPIPPLVRQDVTFFEPPPIIHKRTRSDTQQIHSILKKVGKKWLPVDETSSPNA